MEITTLSSSPGIPFNDTFESFSSKYKLSEDVECYQLFFCPYGNGTSFEDLNKIKFKSRVVILNIVDSIIDTNDNTATKELIEFCANHPEQNFIVSCAHLNIKREVQASNLYLDEIIPGTLTEPFKRCEKKQISNKWISLNSNTKLHRVLTVSYLLSKEYCDNGDFTFNFDHQLLATPQLYKNLGNIPSELKNSFSKGYEQFKLRNFNQLELVKFDWQEGFTQAKNYNNVLLPIYENYAVEIVTGTMFFEKSPLLSEKEMQSIWSKNIPILINGVGMAQEMKKFFDIDLFEDIIDHSYDTIENHFERLAAAIDRNENLLNGSMNIHELWHDNQKRFEQNSDKMESMMFDGDCQKIFNFKKIEQALSHFNVTVI